MERMSRKRRRKEQTKRETGRRRKRKLNLVRLNLLRGPVPDWMQFLRGHCRSFVRRRRNRDFRQWITAEFLCAIAVSLAVLRPFRSVLSPPPFRESLVMSFLRSSFFLEKRTLFLQRPASRIIFHARRRRIDTRREERYPSPPPPYPFPFLPLFNPEIRIKPHEWRDYRLAGLV